MTKTMRRIGRALVVTLGLLLLVLIIAWMSGAFHARVEPGRAGGMPAADAGRIIADVQVQETPVYARSVGSIRAAHETTVGSRLLARVKAVHVTAGQPVSAGQVIVELDEADVQARIEQARANVDAVAARLRQTESDLDKLSQLRQQGAATARELEDARRARDVAEADLAAARQALAEARNMIDYTTIRSPINGVVIDKLVEEGDLAQPGRNLVTLYDPDRLQLEAPVPERIAVGLSVGDAVGVEIDAINLRCDARISEIVPQAAAGSRSMLVKVTGACPPGVYSGMFGRLLIPQGQTRRLLIPQAAVQSVGQLSMVDVVDADGSTQRRLVRLGEIVAGDGPAKVEVLAGLEPGERVIVGKPADQP